MGNIIDDLRALESDKGQSTNANVNQEENLGGNQLSSYAKELQEEDKAKQKEEQNISVPSAIGQTPEEQEIAQSNMRSDIVLGTMNYENLRAEPDTWSPEFSNKTFLGETSTSLARGFGKHIIKGTGDLAQIIGAALPGINMVDGNMLSRSLQEMGEDFANNFQTYMPEELKGENLNFKSAMNPKFWSTHVAELIPQLAEFILLSKGGSAIGRKAASKILGAAGKNTGKLTKLTSGGEVLGTGEGILGKLMTEKGLSVFGNNVIGAVSGGATGNVMSGMLNAAELINSSKELEDPKTGKRLYTDKELSEMAAGTMTNNLMYLPVDMLSYGITFGKMGGKMKNSIRGTKLESASNLMAKTKKKFAYDLGPVIKAPLRIAQKAIPEGIEETFQETFEEWAKLKSIAKVTGKGSDKVLDPGGYWDFYKSKENRATLVLSAAVGGLGGAAFNIGNIIDKKADESLKIYDRTTNLKEIINKQGSELANRYQRYHIRKQIGEIVAERDGDSQETFDQFLSYLEESNINEEESKQYQEMFKEFEELNKTSTALNVKGKDALFRYKADELFLNEEIENVQDNYNLSVKTLNELTSIDEETKAKKMAEYDADFKTKIKALSIMQAAALQNQENLKIGEKAKPYEIHTTVNKYGNEMFIGGLSEDQYYMYTKKGSNQKRPKESVENGNDIKTFLSDTKGKLSEKANTLYDSLFKKSTEEDNETIELDENNNPVLDENGNPKIINEENNSEKNDVQSEESETAEEIELSPEEKAIIEEEEKAIQDKIDKTKVNDNIKDDISEEEWISFDEDNQVKNDRLDKLAQKIFNEETLSNKESLIRNQNPEIIRKKILDIAMGKKSEMDEETQKEVGEEFVKNEISKDDFIDNQINDKVSFSEMTEKEKEYYRNKIDDNDPTLSEEQKQKNKDAVEKLKVREVIPDSEKEAFSGKDKRSSKKPNSDKEKINRAVQHMNYQQFVAKRYMARKVQFITDVKGDRITQNQVDDFLNSFTARNIYEPSEVEKMATVNHRLKQMFPDKVLNDDGTIQQKVRVYSVKNLFESIGSQGVGTTLASTVYIDDKVWDQDEVFMHEMSHIWFQLSENEEETQKLLQSVLKDKDLLKDTIRKYPDYVLYRDAETGNEVTRGDLINAFSTNQKYSKQEIKESVNALIKQNRFEMIPMAEQKHILEEAFVSKLETPLANEMDKTFVLKEQQRKADTIKWFGMLKKKGEIIQNDTYFTTILKEGDPEASSKTTDVRSFFIQGFKNATKKANYNSYGVDKRAAEIDEETLIRHDQILNKIKEQQKFQDEPDTSIAEIQQLLEEAEISSEEYGDSFFDKDFDSAIRRASRVMKRFGAIYNRKLRKKFLEENRGKFINRNQRDLFDKEFFESGIYDLAKENDTPQKFIDNIERSSYQEMKEFNSYLDKVLPDEKYAILNSMHYVMSNAKHINGFKNTLDKNTYKSETAFSQREMNFKENILAYAESVLTKKQNKSEDLKNRREEITAAFVNIYRKRSPENYKNDVNTIIDFLTNSKFRKDKVVESGIITYKGVNIPIDTFVMEYIRTGRVFNNPKAEDSKLNVYAYNLRPMVEAFIDTNRKFTPYSSVKNANGDYEPARIINNSLTKEIDGMTEFLSSNYKSTGKPPTLKDFLRRYSHINYKYSDGRRSDKGKNYVPNLFLKRIYDRFQNGFPPSIMQYYGVQDLQNSTGNTYKNSSDIEQGIEAFMIFLDTSRTFKAEKDAYGKITQKPEKALSSYMGSLGAMSDSPRNFYMSMQRIKYSDVFNDNGTIKRVSNDNDNVITSIYNIHKEIMREKGKPDITRTEFIKNIKKELEKTVDFVKQNAKVLNKLDKTKSLFVKSTNKQTKKSFVTEKLSEEGIKLVKEYAINSIVNGHNVHEVLLPSVKGQDALKRMKSSSSPVFTVKNPNLKTEILPISDEIIGGNIIAGTDSGMYILEEDAEKYRKLGRGVMDLNNGFKFLDSHIEKDHPKFKGRLSYTKGFTTIVGENHPLYKIMKSRKDKYNAWHLKKYGENPSLFINDGTPNQILIAAFISSDKSNFFPDALLNESKTEHTELGAKLTPLSLSENVDEANDYYDKMYYDKNGDFVGLSAENFGPQQNMDKITYEANTPVQMINSIMVNAVINGQMEKVLKIQKLIAAQKQKNLAKKLQELSKETPTLTDYENFVDKHFSKEDMDQAQRILHEQNGSITNPYLNEIAVNTFKKAILRAGNKLKTNGTYAQQKPDIAFRTDGKVNERLKASEQRTDGTWSQAEIVLPMSMNPEFQDPQYKKNKKGGLDKRRVKARKYFEPRKDENLNDFMKKVVDLASQQYGVSKAEAANKYVGTSTNENGDITGYFIKGETVMVSRVPGHGPATTNFFEVIGFDDTPGNQVQVPAEFNHIIGSDNDGDALFVQTKGGKEMSEWNSAFDMLVDYWSSPEMHKQASAPMDFEPEKQMTKREFKKGEGSMLYSPVRRMEDYNNTMVAKRSVGPVFNIHKITNLLAAYEIELENTITIGGNDYTAFVDSVAGDESRNQQSAKLGNIILDNSKHQMADALGLNEHTIPQAVLLVNLGVDLKTVGKIMTSTAVKKWTEHNRSNNSMFHPVKKKPTILKDIENELEIKIPKGINGDVIVPDNLNTKEGQQAVLSLMSYLSEMNGDIQKVSAIMSGHKDIHVNPLVLEKQMQDYLDVVGNKNDKKSLKFTKEFQDNPDLRNYYNVAEVVLENSKIISPVYRASTKQVLDNIVSKLGPNVSTNAIEDFSEDLRQFITSRLLGLNNVDADYVSNLLNPNSNTSIFEKLRAYVTPLRNNVKVNKKNAFKNINQLDNSILFKRALNYNIDGNNKYISASTSFVNDSFTPEERMYVQEEFEQLPPDFQKDLLIYDLAKNGWNNRQSIIPFVGRSTIDAIDKSSRYDNDFKDTEINPNVLSQLEKIIALKSSKEKSNPFMKVYFDPNDDLKDKELVAKKIFERKNNAFKNEGITSQIIKGQPLFVVARKTDRFGKDISELYEFPPFTTEQNAAFNADDSNVKKTQTGLNFAIENMQIVSDEWLGSNPIVAPITIKDNNVMDPWTPPEGKQNKDYFDPLVEASILYEEALEKGAFNNNSPMAMDARESYYEETFTRKEPLTLQEYIKAKEFPKTMGLGSMRAMYDDYVNNKKIANEEAKTYLPTIEDADLYTLLEDYKTYGKKDVYAYSVIMTPLVKKIANIIAQDQMTLHNSIKEDGKDISMIKAYLTTGSTIPKNHPATQGMIRMIEKNFKSFMNEKKKYVEEINRVTDNLYQSKLGYKGKWNVPTILKRVRDVFFGNREKIYNDLYGNLVIRKEFVDENGRQQTEFKLKNPVEIKNLYQKGIISPEEKEFYDVFKKVTSELKPKNLKKEETDYIPHTSMNNLEMMSSRGMLGLLLNSRGKDNVEDVKVYFNTGKGKELMTFKSVKNHFLIEAKGKGNNVAKILAYRKMERKANKLLKTGKNENGTPITFNNVAVDTALGFGAINRFAENRSVKAKTIPSMDLNKALIDYTHANLFVEGNENVKGMKDMQGIIDGVLAHNYEQGYKNVNTHVQKQWKDYFLRGKRQTSVLGENADKVIRGLTRLNLFYSLGYQANVNTKGLYVIGNILAGKYHNIKDLGGKAWIKGELRYWGLDKGISEFPKRFKRNQEIMKTINFMEINVYDQVDLEKKKGLDSIMVDLALMPMVASEDWIQKTHILGMLTDEEYDKFDENGKYKTGAVQIPNSKLIKLEDQVKRSHGRGYQPTDQRAVQMYSLGEAALQFSKFIPTMFQDRFAKEDVNIYGQETIGTLRSVGHMVRHAVNNPKDFKKYRASLSEEKRQQLDKGLRGAAFATVLSMLNVATESDTGESLYWDTNYYWNHPKLSGKMIPAAFQSTNNLLKGIF